MLDRQPPCDAAIMLCLRAWRELDTCRGVGMDGAGPVPWTAVREWCDFHGLDYEVSVMLINAIRYLDVRRAEEINAERRLAEARR